MRMKRRSCYLSVVLAAAGLLAAGCAAGGRGSAGGAGAAHVWPGETTVAYVLTSGQSQQVDIPGQGSQVTNESSTLDMTVAAAGPRQFTITVTEAVASSDAEMMGAEVPDISALVGLECAVTLDERGEIISATGLEQNGFIEDSGGVEPFTEQLQGLFLTLPEGGLQVGAEWSRESELHFTQMDGTELQVTTVERYICREATEYAGMEAWIIDLVSESAMSGTGETGGMPMDLVLSGTGRGTIWVARGTAMMLGAESKGNLEGGIAVAGMDLPLTLISSATLVKK